MRGPCNRVVSCRTPDRNSKSVTKKIISLIFALYFLSLIPYPLSFISCAFGGDISPGAVPGSINYQGRLEKDNAPITGPVHITFRIYDAQSGGHLLWESPEVLVQAIQGIFSAAITPPISLFSKAETRYLEVQIESDVLSPREPFQSVVYSIVSQRLEDGQNLAVSSFTTAYQVMLATASGNVGIGNVSPDQKLVVNGNIRITGGGQICFDGSGCLNTGGLVGTGSGVLNDADAIITSDNDNAGGGDIILRTWNNERMRILNTNGYIGINTSGPDRRFEVLDSANPQMRLTQADNVTYADFQVDSSGDLIMNMDGITNQLALDNAGNIGIGTASPLIRLAIGDSDTGLHWISDNNMAVYTGNTERIRINSAGNIGIGLTNPSSNLHVQGSIVSNSGAGVQNVLIGGYGGSLSNEVRSQGSNHLLLQQTNSYNVGIGTDTPREKLHVDGNIRANSGILANTGVFDGNVLIKGNLTANTFGATIKLSSTVVYGTLQVTGGIGSNEGFPAYLPSTQTFTGPNTFSNRVNVSTDIYVSNRMGIGVVDFDFPPQKYLQIGDNKPEFAATNALQYLVAGENANAKIHFYRGANEAARIETQNGNNLATVVQGSAKSIVDSDYYKIQNSILWVGTTTPSIYVSSTMGNVGMGISVLDPNWKLTVNGNIRITGSLTNALIFADGSKMTSANLGSASSVASNADAVIQSDADANGSGSVILKTGTNEVLFVKSDGKIGIGTSNPVAKLNVRGGDVVIGNPSGVDSYLGNASNDLLIDGYLVLDGGMVQRGATPAEFETLLVRNNVYLSTATGANTGIGTITPKTKLEVNGNAQFGAGVNKSTFTATGVLQLASPLGAGYGGTGADFSAAALGDVPYFTAGGTMARLGYGTANYLLQTNGNAIPSWVQATDSNVINTVVRRDGSGGFSAGAITAAGTLTMSGVTNDIVTPGAEHLAIMPGGNVGIGTASPGSKLTVFNGDIRFSTTTGDRGIIFQDGTTLTTAGDTSSAGGVNNTGNAIILADSDKILGGEVLLRTGTDISGPYTRLRIQNNGNTMLTNRFQIGNAASLWIDDSIAGWTNGFIANDGALFVPLNNGVANSDLRLYITDDADDSFSIWGNTCGGGTCDNLDVASIVAMFKAGGNVGIGTTDPGARLEVSQGIKALSANLTQTGATQYSLETSSGIWVKAGSLNMNGTARIINLLEPQTAQEAATKNYVDNATGGGGAWGLSGNNISPGDVLGTTGSGDDLILVTVGSERMRITSGGNVGIGTTNPGTNKLDVAGTIDGDNFTEAGSNTLSNNISGNAATASAASALAGNGTNCSAGNYARGVDNSGNAEDCTGDAVNDSVSGGELDGVFSTTGLLRRTGGSTYSTITDNSSNWDTGYSERRQWDGGSTNLVAATGRTSLGLGSLATLSAVSGGVGGTITDTTITNDDISGTAAIAGSKISGWNGTNWDTGYSERRQWDGGSTNLNAATGRTSLSVAELSAASAGKAVCWKTATSLGYCSTQPDANGNCTCN